MVKEKTKLQERVERLLKEKHLTKVAMADSLGLSKQNVDRVFKTQRIPQMKTVADFLGISIENLLMSNSLEDVSRHKIDGFIELDGSIYRIRSKEDFMKVVRMIEE